jgi:outer membrane lipopolysaccharide assembly protein LptE/RlpB
MRLRFAFVALSVAFWLAGCGYGFIEADAVPAEIRDIRVARVDVGESDPRLGDEMARALRRVFRREGRFRMVEATSSADAVLKVTITGYRSRGVAFDKFDDVLDYEATMVAHAVLERAGGSVLWEASGISSSRGHAAVAGAVVTSSAAFQAGERLERADLGAFDDVQLGEDRKAAARERLLSDMAEAIYSQLTEGY